MKDQESWSIYWILRSRRNPVMGHFFGFQAQTLFWKHTNGMGLVKEMPKYFVDESILELSLKE